MTTKEFESLKLRDVVHLMKDNKPVIRYVNKKWFTEEIDSSGNDVQSVKISISAIDSQRTVIENGFVRPEDIFLTKEDLLKSL